MNNGTQIIIKPLLEKLFWNGWKQHQIIMFTAPCGFGKTTVAKALLSKEKVCEISVLDSEFLPEDILHKSTVVLIDDLQYLLDRKKQRRLCDLILARADLHFVFLSRGHLPGWLMPFQLDGNMLILEASQLKFDPLIAQKMLESQCTQLSDNQKNELIRLTDGYPAALSIICRKLKNGAKFTKETIPKIEYDLFFYFEDAIYMRFEAPLRYFLLSIAPFESFNIEFARIVSEDSRAGEFLGTIQRDTNMLSFDKTKTYHIYPFFQRFLLWLLQQQFTTAEHNMLYSRAAQYYELNRDLENALKFYSLAGEQNKVWGLLVKNSEENPNDGNYFEMKNYYFALSRDEVLKSPSLISGMSMLTALCMDYEASESWYKDLQNYLAHLNKEDYEYKNVKAKLIYLDIGLPQRHSQGLIKTIISTYRLVIETRFKISPLSITNMLPSIMNGDKDFCYWSKKDDILYGPMKKPLETLLGKGGIGIVDCGICESKFEKGEDVSKRLLTLMSRLGEIQARGTPEVEFAVIGLLARVQISQGNARTALESIQSLRDKFCETGQTRFLGNIDAMICRINLQLGNIQAAHIWFQDKAPKNDVQLWIMWRYQYLTRVMVQIYEEDYEDALILLSRLLPYFNQCKRVMDSIYIHMLKSLCHEALGGKSWRDELNIALDSCYEYNFIWPVAQYGVAILPLLKKSKWTKDLDYLNELISATRVQAAQYPKFLKSQRQLVEPLSPAENQVLSLLCENLTNQEIGDILGIKLSTVKSHVSHILHKLGVNRRSEAKTVAEELQLIKLG